MSIQTTFSIPTKGRGMINVTSQINNIITTSAVRNGLCNIFLHHTSASLILCENADKNVQTDLENFMQRLVPDGDKLFIHTDEGPDDMPAHIRTVLTQNSLSIPISKGHLGLGTWQGVYLWEHRLNSHQRQLTITIMEI